jgi:hypothetical protein
VTADEHSFKRLMLAPGNFTGPELFALETWATRQEARLSKITRKKDRRKAVEKILNGGSA